MTEGQTKRLIEGLKQARAYPHDSKDIECIETHISYVFLTGRFAYKIKKPVKFPFVDFSTLDRRHYFCRRELQLNRRFAPDLYLEVVNIAGPADAPTIGGTPAIEFAVKMRQFEPERLGESMLQRNELTPALLVSLAGDISEIHASLEAECGRPPIESMNDNLGQVEQALRNRKSKKNDDHDLILRRVRSWVDNANVRLERVFTERYDRGLVRDCHGDLHLSNLASIDGKLVPFDCLEFDDKLRTIDLIDEISFLSMDLIAHSRNDLAYCFVNAYLHATGDYDGLRVWRYYCVHRALVRAKVKCLADWAAAVGVTGTSTGTYLAVADRLTEPVNPLLVITMGLSGSGKTTVTNELIGLLSAIRVRSDVERKRLHDIPGSASSQSGVGSGIYDDKANDATYDRVYDAARFGLDGGVSMIIDASFIDRNRRRRFRALAAARDVPFVIVNCTAPEATLRERIQRRAESRADESEADLAVLRHQIENCDPLDEDELRHTIDIDTTAALDPQALVNKIERFRNG